MLRVCCAAVCLQLEQEQQQLASRLQQLTKPIVPGTPPSSGGSTAQAGSLRGAGASAVQAAYAADEQYKVHSTHAEYLVQQLRHKDNGRQRKSIGKHQEVLLMARLDEATAATVVAVAKPYTNLVGR